MDMSINQLGTLTDHELETLCVPIKECVSVSTGSIEPAILSKLEVRGFDQAPVYHHEKSCLLGLVNTDRLRRLHDGQQELDPDDKDICDKAHCFYIGPFVTVEQVLEKNGAG